MAIARDSSDWLVSRRRIQNALRSISPAKIIAVNMGLWLVGLGLGVSGATAYFLSAYSKPMSPPVAEVKAPAGVLLPAAIQRGEIAPPPLNGRYFIGDRLKLVFLERIGENQGLDTDNTFVGFVERVELTGEYVVQQNGRISVPLLGSVEVEGDSEQGLGKLVYAFKHTFGTHAKVSVTTVEQEPIYVIGARGRSGTFRFTPGMSVLHALAMSGTTDGDRSEFHLRAEQLHALERLEQSRVKLTRLLPKLAILRAEQTGGLTETPAALVDLVGAAQASSLMDEATRTRALILASRQPLYEVHRVTIAAARRENAALSRKLAPVQRQITAFGKKSPNVAARREKGPGVPASFYPTFYKKKSAERAQVQAQEPEFSIALSATDQRIEEERQQLTKLDADFRVELARELSAVDEEVQEQHVAFAASQRFISDSKIASLRLEPGLDNLSFRIVRRSRAGLQTIPAAEDTELMPGDLVRISGIPGPTAH